MIFDDFFESVVVISLRDKRKRADQCLKQLQDYNLSGNARVVEAIHGQTVGVPSWFKWGAGAWGCLLSHMRVLQDFSMAENYRGISHNSMLVLEDDAIFEPNSYEIFKRFSKNIPNDWGQLYLGGQHTLAPKVINDCVVQCQSVNRTHAYAVNAGSVAKISQHITDFPNYFPTNSKNHIDHQLEKAHRKGLWKVYAPKRWIVGQGAHRSDISQRSKPDLWWDWDFGDQPYQQEVIINLTKNKKYIGPFFNYGTNVAEDGVTATIFKKDESSPKALRAFVRSLIDESWSRRQTPCFAPITKEQEEVIKHCFAKQPLYV